MIPRALFALVAVLLVTAVRSGAVKPQGSFLGQLRFIITSLNSSSFPPFPGPVSKMYLRDSLASERTILSGIAIACVLAFLDRDTLPAALPPMDGERASHAQADRLLSTIVLLEARFVSVQCLLLFIESVFPMAPLVESNPVGLISLPFSPMLISKILLSTHFV